MHSHQSFREHLQEHAAQGHEPQFEPVVLEPLVEFDRLFAQLDVFSFDVNKFLSAHSTAEVYVVSSETIAHEGDEPEIAQSQWSAVWPGHDPIDGFAGSPGSVFTQTSGNTPLPDTPRTRALLLLVTSDFVHLSASRDQSPPLVRGAVNGPGDGYRYVVLERPASTP